MGPGSCTQILFQYHRTRRTAVWGRIGGGTTQSKGNREWEGGFRKERKKLGALAQTGKSDKRVPARQGKNWHSPGLVNAGVLGWSNEGGKKVNGKTSEISPETRGGKSRRSHPFKCGEGRKIGRIRGKQKGVQWEWWGQKPFWQIRFVREVWWSGG